MTAMLTVGLAAFGVPLLTLFTGFGLGTLLMPTFALFLPIEVAVAATGVVHAGNDLFKVGILAGAARREVVLRFGVPATPWTLVATASLCAFGGAYLGRRLLPAVSIAALRGVIGVLLLVVGCALSLGIA